MRSSARSIDEVEQLVGLQRIARQPMVERVLDRLLDDALRRCGGEAVLGLALEFRLADEHREHAAGAGHHVFAGDGGCALFLADAGGVILQARAAARCAGRTHACRRPASGWCCSRIEEAVGVGGPGHRPFDRAVAAGLAGRAGEDVGMHQRRAVEIGRRDNPSSPSAKWKVAFSGTSSTPLSSSLAQCQRISTPPNR